MPKSPPSTRATNHVTLVHGMVSMPLSIYSGTNKESGVTRHQYISVPVMEPDGKGGEKQKEVEVEKEDGTKESVPVFRDVSVGRGATNKETGELLGPDSPPVESKVETEYGPVYVNDSEIETLFTLEPNELKVIAFQPQSLLARGEYVPKDIMHVVPAKVAKKRSERVEKLVATLFQSMRDEGVMAVCELTTRGTPKPCILMPDGRLWIIYYTEATREQAEMPEVETNPAEVQMMRQLIGMATENDALDIANTRDPLIQAFAEEKAAAGDFGKAEDTTTVTEVSEPANDLMAMLQASVDAAKAQQAEAV